MKQIIFIFMSLLCFSCSSKAQNQTADTNVQSDKKILVVLELQKKPPMPLQKRLAANFIR
jgi:uncharacterized protein YcfL